MELIKISKNEKIWLKNKYPNLRFKKNFFKPTPKIVGNLEFDMSYDKKNSPYSIHYDNSYVLKGFRIKDSYQIEIILERSKLSLLPKVKETGNRILKIAEERKLDQRDLHIDLNGFVCLCSRIKEKKYLPNGFNLEDFFHNLLIPFFYWESYFEKFNKEPWKHYSHGELGLLESYAEIEVVDKDVIEKILLDLKLSKNWEIYKDWLFKKGGNIQGHWDCLCGSSKEIRICHPKVFQGLWNLKEDIKNFLGEN